ncbi:ABC transporter permease [Rhizobium oryzicola]|uniref:ABC transporter permease n=1 Tax=Rhizobium oryzicola TaxID=1232668 RepID=A0ABT8SPR6_9HYPH|nr:ABC transporter permease [Rhizobium oryzicola]MDO1580515.1 ABC transporter permease [Rhizobium oryzicola]
MSIKPQADAVQLVLAALIAFALALPFATLKPNRIVPGQPLFLLDGPPFWARALVILALIALATVTWLGCRPSLRIVVTATALMAVILALGSTAGHLPPSNAYARLSPAAGFWLLTGALGLGIADGFARLKPSPLAGLMAVLAAVLILAGLFSSGWLSGISILREYQGRSDVFWREAVQHVWLAIGSLAAAIIIGIPFGLLCHRRPRLKAVALNGLNIVQTIPSIALFGILIGPMAWIGSHVPGASALGIAGIGAAPAFVALLLYSLLPMVANTLSGLAAVPRDLIEAARGMGMTDRQRLWKVEVPLALPVLLAAVRIVLVQNIGLATVAALIGGGGFGVFVFQGLGQNAADLILLGALPTVGLAFVAAVIMDALIAWSAPRKGRGSIA